MSNQFEQPENYRNRELSWLEFDYRVLSEARDKSLPLFERLKFLSITASNLDEFPILILAISIRLLMHFMLLRVQDGVPSAMHFQAVQML